MYEDFRGSPTFRRLATFFEQRLLTGLVRMQGTLRK